MNTMAQRKHPGMDAAEESAPLPPATFPVVVSVHDSLTCVALGDLRHTPVPDGVCRCDACGAVAATEHRRFI
jgi:hypothetical protein